MALRHGRILREKQVPAKVASRDDNFWTIVGNHENTRFAVKEGHAQLGLIGALTLTAMLQNPVI